MKFTEFFPTGDVNILHDIRKVMIIMDLSPDIGSQNRFTFGEQSQKI